VGDDGRIAMRVGLSPGVGETATGGAVSSVLTAAFYVSTVKGLEVEMSSVVEMVEMAAWLTKVQPLAISSARQRRIKSTRWDGIKLN